LYHYTAIGVVKGGALMVSGVRYVPVSIPKAIADKIDELIEDLGYWPSRSSFVREASLEKIRAETHRLERLREARAPSGS
jgi:Arc/MetJ-type ribon-helix-helix transcriptional regulator